MISCWKSFKDSFECSNKKKRDFSLHYSQKMINPLIEHELKHDYDLIVDVDSLTNLKKSGWPIYYTHPEIFSKLEEHNIIIGVLGFENVGKSYLLSILSGKNLTSGYNISTKGLSFKISERENEHIVFIDSIGIGKPFEFYDDNVNNKETLMNDSIMTESLIQDYVLENCNVILLVINILTQDSQKLLYKIVSEYPKKKVIILHNFLYLENIDDVKKKIERDIFNSFPVKTFYMNSNHCSNEKNIEYYQEINEKTVISHFIYAKEDSEAGKYYNKTTLEFVINLIKSDMNYKQFSFVNSFKETLHKSNLQKFVTFNNNIEPYSIIFDDDLIKFNKKVIYEIKKCSLTAFGSLFLENKLTNFNPPHKIFESKEKYVIFLSIPGKTQSDEIILSEINHKDGFGIIIEGKCDSLIKETINLENNINNEEIGEINGKFYKEIYFAETDEINFREKKIQYHEGIYIIQIPKKKIKYSIKEQI